eukprot:CAMPEP_0198119002 /NCGR_PEP_ID=MMETSP1442-20131203/23938_1 /TAXON_ID= /ORGANISM="Craspedostauros australis, Strain CCMP3328" /LENGTH=143 /DNA_ID=CAMNT_0043777381 /DNA_START=44 /DNA_END=471 /DNA_ORIENTATION=+
MSGSNLEYSYPSSCWETFALSPLLLECGEGGLLGGRRTRLKLLHENVNLGFGDVGHDDDVGHVLFARQLPPSDEFLGGGTLQDHRVAVRVVPARNADALELFVEVLRGGHAVVDVVGDAGHALLAQAVPEVEGRLAVAAAEDG